MSNVIGSTSYPTSGTRYDTSPVGHGGKNWVTKAGGLPPFIRAVAHALIRNGHPESGAIQMAIGVIKGWAAGEGKVTAKTRAKAAATVAEWEAMKASTGRSDPYLEYRASGAFAAGHTFEGNQWTAGPNAQAPPGEAQQQLGMTNAQVYLLAVNIQQATGAKVTGILTNGQLAAVTSAMGKAGAAKAAKGGAAGKAAANKAAASLKQAQAKAAAAAAKAASQKAAAEKLSANLAKIAAQPVNTGSLANANLTNSLSAANRTTLAANLPPAGFAWKPGANGPTLQPATPLAAAQAALISKSPAFINHQLNPTGLASVPGQANPTAVAAASGKAATSASQKQANSINTLTGTAKTNAQKGVPPVGFMWQGGNLVASHRSDEFDFGTRALGEFGAAGPGTNATLTTPDASGAGALLPNGPSKKVADRIVTTMGRRHKFAGSDLSSCATCGKAISSSIHKRVTAGQRWDTAASNNPNLVAPLDLTRYPASVLHHMRSAKAQSVADRERLVPMFEKILRKHFADQRTSTLNRLRGKRGAQMIRRAAQGPEFPDGEATPDAVTPPPALIAGASAAAVDPQAIFDDQFWTASAMQALEATYATAGAMAVGRVKQQAQIVLDVEDKDSLAGVDKILARRAESAAYNVTEATRKAIFGALQQGMAEGEGIEPLAARINAIFDHADSVRAHMIAQNEALGALNAAANEYAEHLPEGIVGAKMWLSHHDDRTRPTHRLADGQTVPRNKPFWVGGFPMDHPYDRKAPISEWINCRCDTAFLSSEMAVPVVGVSELEGLIPSTSLAALDNILAKQKANRLKAVSDAQSAVAADA